MKRIFGLLIVIILSFWAVKPLFGNGYFPMHDDTQVARVVVMGRALREGQFPVRWVTDLGYGYGYPIYNFYGPLPYYVGGILYAVGLNGLIATKIMFGIGMILAGLAMYVCIGSMFGTLAGVLSAIVYEYAPYHAVQLYVRGAIGEVWAYAFLPLVVLGIILMHTKIAEKRGILLGGLGLSGIILSHTILGYVTVLFVLLAALAEGVIAVVTSASWDLAKRYAVLIVVGLGVSSFFWIPALFEMRFTNVAGQISETANFRDHFVCFSQLWSSSWGYGGSAKGCIDGLSFMLGKAHILLAGLSTLLFLFFRKKMKSGRLPGIVLLSIVGIFTLLTLAVSQVIWEILPMFSYVQYPWRFLTYTILGLSGLAAFFVLIPIPKAIRFAIAFVVVTIVVMYNAKWFTPERTYVRPIEEFESDEDIRFRVSKISDEYLPPDFQKPKDKTQIPHDTIRPSDDRKVAWLVDSDTYAKFAITSDAQQSVQIQRTYFPGWHYWVNGKEVIPSLDHGLPSILIPSGDSVVEMRLIDTPVRRVANGVSILVVAAILYLYGKENKKTNA